MTATALTALAALALSAAGAPAAPGNLLGLEDAVRMARENHPQARQARAGTEAAAARADQARAALLPQVTGSGSYLRATNQPNASGAAGTGKAAAQLSQLVWDFGQTTGRWEAARAGAEAQRDAEAASELQILLGVRTAYFAARAARDLLAVARETLENQENHLRQIQGFVEVGTRPEIDLAQARTDRANAKVQLIGAENGYETAKAQLNLAMGYEGPTDYEVAAETLPPVAGEERPTDELVAEALRERADVAAAASQIRAQEAALRAARGGFLPSLGVSAGISRTFPQDEAAFNNWSAGATLTWNLLSGGATWAQAREAQANLDSFSAQAAALRQQVRLEVDQARLGVRAAVAAQAAAGEALLNARERLRLAEGRYQTGAGSAIEQGDAQLALTAAAAQKVQADYSLASARAQLLRALGRRP